MTDISTLIQEFIPSRDQHGESNQVGLLVLGWRQPAKTV
jgi:hypothetical protein